MEVDSIIIPAANAMKRPHERVKCSPNGMIMFPVWQHSHLQENVEASLRELSVLQQKLAIYALANGHRMFQNQNRPRSNPWHRLEVIPDSIG